MNVKKVMLLTATMALVVAPCLAGPGPGRAGGGPMGGPGMHGPLGPIRIALEQLDLTTQQQEQIETILTEGQTTLAPIREELHSLDQAFRDSQDLMTVDEAAIRTHVAERALLEADLKVAEAGLRVSVLGVLTSEQLEALEQVLAELETAPGPGGPGGSGQAPPTW